MLNLPKLIGHRGVKNLSPENTTNSILLAKKLGLNWVEFDVKVSKDLVPVLFHDDCLDRTTNGKGFLVDYLYKDLKKLDAGFFFYNKITKIYIPSFYEILFLCKKNNININIELKPNKGFERQNVISIFKVIKNFKFSNQFYFSSFDWSSLIMMKELLPEANYGLLIDKFKKNKNLNDIKTIASKYNFFCCGFNKEIINSEIINNIIKNNLKITIYSSINLKINEANVLWNKGVTSIFTDDPRSFKLV